MKPRYLQYRISILFTAFALVLAMSVPVSASIFQNEAPEITAVSNFSKNGTIDEIIHFSSDDFRVTGSEEKSLDSVILTSLPSTDAGFLTLGDEALACGDIISLTAINGLQFTPLASPSIASTQFSFIPVFSDGNSGTPAEVNLYLLTTKNSAPIAENIEFSTYKNVSYTGLFSAVDPEGDLLSFQLVNKPARGSITITEEGNGEFVYTPYENKVGKDTFSYVAIDSLGNRSKEAVVKVKIEKPSTKVTYADMDGHSAYNAAIRLAEEGIYIGANMDDLYYFQPDTHVSRSEFLTLAMSAIGMEELEGITRTGFFDDNVIQTWAKPYVSSALKSGVIQGMISENGQVVFGGDCTVSSAEAAVMLNRMLSISDISADTWSGNTSTLPAWASQAVMNLETVGVLNQGSDGIVALNEELTRAEAAKMLAGALDVLDARNNK